MHESRAWQHYIAAIRPPGMTFVVVFARFILTAAQ
jgi:hypothetical protein